MRNKLIILLSIWGLLVSCGSTNSNPTEETNQNAIFSTENEDKDSCSTNLYGSYPMDKDEVSYYSDVNVKIGVWYVASEIHKTKTLQDKEIDDETAMRIAEIKKKIKEREEYLKTEKGQQEKREWDSLVRNGHILPEYTDFMSSSRFQGDDNNLFQGEGKTMEKWIKEHVNYPEEALKDRFQGKVIIEFVIDERGYIKKARVLRSPSPLLLNEALRVVMSLPRFYPAIGLDGEPRDQTWVVPVPFTLPESKAE